LNSTRKMIVLLVGALAVALVAIVVADRLGGPVELVGLVAFLAAMAVAGAVDGATR